MLTIQKNNGVMYINEREIICAKIIRIDSSEYTLQIHIFNHTNPLSLEFDSYDEALINLTKILNKREEADKADLEISKKYVDWCDKHMKKIQEQYKKILGDSYEWQ